MPVPVARFRALSGAAVLLTAAGSLLLASGTSSATSPGRAAVVYGPLAPVPAARPLVRTDGPLLRPVVPVRQVRLASLSRHVGPPQGTVTRPAGPPGVVGPGSPLRQVREVQRLLNATGAQLRVDGAWGPATTRAVQRLQAQAGLPVDGRVGPRTAVLLRR